MNKLYANVKLKSVDIHIACLIVQFVANDILICLKKKGTIETILKEVKNSKFINVKLKQPNYIQLQIKTQVDLPTIDTPKK